MAYASMPVITVHTPKIDSNQLSMGTLTEILESESVKRLLSRQNVFLHAPLSEGSITSCVTVTPDVLRKDESLEREKESCLDKLPELSIFPIADSDPREQDDESEASADDEHLLPSKNQGKSEIALLPLAREVKTCGHVEPCESVLCKVELRKAHEDDNIVPLIAVSIDPSEIDAPVAKHCDNKECDALSIDHDRCRRAVVRCHRNDSFNICDICLVSFKTRKAQLKHKKCAKRGEYTHNETSKQQLMKDLMRLKELEILDAARMRKRVYSDTTMSDHERVVESLQRNTELIVIPRTSPPIQQHPTIRITSVTGAPMSGESLRKLVTRSQSDSSRESADPEEPEIAPPAEVVPPPLPQMIPYVTANGTQIVTENGMRAINVVDHSKAQNVQLKSFLMPIRVIPITGLKTEPSLMHQTHGIPKFCFVAETPKIPIPKIISKPPRKILPALRPSDRESTANVHSQKTHFNGDTNKLKFKPGIPHKKAKRKNFQCSFCHKRFSTNWYFKLHIAKHRGEVKFTCTFCGKMFMQQDNMTKHIMTVHTNEPESIRPTDNSAVVSITQERLAMMQENGQRLHCLDCKIVFESLTEMNSHSCEVSRRIAIVEKSDPLRIESERREDQEIKQKRSKGKNRAKKGRKIQREQARGAKGKARNREMMNQRVNGVSKRKRTVTSSNERRGTKGSTGDVSASTKTPTRRLSRIKKRKLANQLDTRTIKKNPNGNCTDKPSR